MARREWDGEGGTESGKREKNMDVGTGWKPEKSTGKVREAEKGAMGGECTKRMRKGAGDQQEEEVQRASRQQIATRRDNGGCDDGSKMVDIICSNVRRAMWWSISCSTLQLLRP